MKQVIVVLGAQWGDEGKGKVVDVLSEQFDVVTRYQGGHNAGHTVWIGKTKYILKLIPSGILRPGVRAVIGNGLVIDPTALLDEIKTLEGLGVDVKRQLSISNRAHLIFPFHRIVEQVTEGREGRVAIGTTSRGIGPAYEDKTARRGIRIADLLNHKVFCELFRQQVEDKQTVAAAFGIEDTTNYDEVRQSFEEFGDAIRPLVCDTARLLNESVAAGKRILFEGAQGTMLDIDHGTYPFVTSSNATAGGVSTGSGLPPTKIDGIIGISKAYITRVGAGPFPSEAHGDEGQRIREAGHEYGTVTGRPRRCGWFDAPLLRYTSMINGFDTLVITKLDVLDELEEVRVCTGYRIDGEMVKDMPAVISDLEKVEAVYAVLPGWKTPISDVRRFGDLPAEAQRYLEFLERQTGVEIGAISVGPERTQTIVQPGSKMEEFSARA